MVYKMSSFAELIYVRYIRKYTTLILIVCMILLFGLFGYYGYKRFYANKQHDKKFQNVANANTRGKPAEVLFFYADWCPHCKKAKPMWFQFKEEYNGQVINGWQINCREIDCTDEENMSSNALIAKYKIESYPSIIMLVGDNRIDFDSKVTKDALAQLVASGTK
jgi:thiol-disulfide isomerase/thioredoxin